MHNTGNSIYRPYDQFINQMVLFGPVIANRILLRASEWLAFFFRAYQKQHSKFHSTKKWLYICLCVGKDLHLWYSFYEARS